VIIISCFSTRLTPSQLNVLVDASGHARLADFGLAVVTRDPPELFQLNYISTHRNPCLPHAFLTAKFASLPPHDTAVDTRPGSVMGTLDLLMDWLFFSCLEVPKEGEVEMGQVWVQEKCWTLLVDITLIPRAVHQIPEHRDEMTTSSDAVDWNDCCIDLAIVSC